MITQRHITALNTSIKLLEEAEFDKSAISLLKELMSYTQELVNLEIKDEYKTAFLEDPRNIPAFCAAFAAYFGG